jgi:hypothetical protein
MPKFVTFVWIAIAVLMYALHTTTTIRLRAANQRTETVLKLAEELQQLAATVADQRDKAIAACR